MRLIDADELIDWICNDSGDKMMDEYYIEHINNMPTAYDVDKVIEQLEDRSTLSRPVGWSKSYEIVTLDETIEIVKGGGADVN